MISKGIATFTLDYGSCPRWLWERMVLLSKSAISIIIDEYGPEEFIRRLADPVWFQSLGTVLAFDWNASGLTTILTAAIKTAIQGQEKTFGFFAAGGKGKTSRKTPDEIMMHGECSGLNHKLISNLMYCSKISAKVDSSMIQDGYTLYHHAFFFTPKGSWTVIQQGMNQNNLTARRYHWHSHNVVDPTITPHTGIASQKHNKGLNLTAKKSSENKNIALELLSSGYPSVMKEINLLRKHSNHTSSMSSFGNSYQQLTLLELYDTDFTTHSVTRENFSASKYLEKILFEATEHKPKTFKEFLSLPGVGPKTIRALSLVAEIIYGAKPSYTDPARYSFAHGGKDAIPYPIDRKTYDQSISFFEKLARKIKQNKKNYFAENYKNSDLYSSIPKIF